MKPFRIGTDRTTGRSIKLRPEQLFSHGLVAGVSGMGKSVLANLLIRHCLKNGIPAVYLDPHGDTYRDIVDYATARRLRRRLVTIDANEAADNVVFPLNFLLPNGLDSATQASKIMKAMAKVFREQDAAVKPRLERHERMVLIPLIEARLTLAEALPFLSIDDNRFRQQVLARVSNPYVLAEWQEFERIARRTDKESMLESVLNRFAKLFMDAAVRRLFGTETCNLDWERVRRDRLVVLVNLQPERISREVQLLLGMTLLDHLSDYAMQQTKKENSMLVLADEMDELASPDFALMFQAFRKRGIFCWSFLQYLEQLRSRDDTNRLYASAMANSAVKIVFRSSYEDAALLARELFPGTFRGDLVKDELYRTMLLPKESRRQVIGTAVSEMEATSESESEADFDGVGFASSSGDGFVDAEGQSFGGASGGLVQSSEFSSLSSASGASSSSMSGSTSSQSSSRTRAQGRSRSEATVPFYEYERAKELAGRQYYSVEEELEKRIAAIQQQVRREAIVKIGDGPAIPIVTAYLRPVRVRPQDRRRTLDELARRYGIPVADVDAAILARRTIVAPEDSVDGGNTERVAELFRPQRRKR